MTSPPPATDTISPRARAGGGAPPAADVPGNLWTAIDVADIGDLTPIATVSVLVTGPDPDGLAPLTVAALAGQSYPANLLTVVVASESAPDEAALRAAAGDLNLTVASGADAVEAASGEVLVVVPAGSVPDRELVEAHARWHHAVADAVSTGVARLADVGGLDPVQVRDAQRDRGLEALLGPRLVSDDTDHAALEAYLEETRGLTERRPDIFRVAARGTLGLRAETYRRAGGAGSVSDHHLARLDLAYRLDCDGCVFVPERAARSYTPYPEGWIAGPAAEDADDPEAPDDSEAPAGAGGMDPRVASLIPVRGFRPRGSGRVFARPAMVVDVPAEGRAAVEVLDAVDAVLRGHLSDLAVRVQLPDGHPERATIADGVEADPRVSVGGPSREERSESPYRVTLAPEAVPDEHTLDALHSLMSEDALGALRVTVPGRIATLTVAGRKLPGRLEAGSRRLASASARLGRGGATRVVATAALARARRVAERGDEPVERVLARLFGERRVSGEEVGIRRRGAPEPDASLNGSLGPATDLAHERAEHLRFRARAATSQARFDRQAQRLYRERMRANHERTRADRLEVRLARVSPRHWVVWKGKRVGRRAAAVPKRLWARVERVRHPLYRLKQSARGGGGEHGD